MNRTNMARRWLAGRLLLGLVLISGLMLLAACGSSDHAASSPSPPTPPAASPAVVASPQASPVDQLPLTVSADGLAVTLVSITKTKAATRVSFSVQLPKAITGTTTVVPLLIRPSDVQLTAGNETVGAPTIAMEPRAPGTDAAFTLTFGSVADSPRTMTLKLARIQVNVAIPGTPFTTKSFSGPWAFTLTPQQLANQPLPTPDHLGIYDHLTTKQAEQMIGFPLIEPTLPPVFDLSQSEITAGAFGTTGSAYVNWVIMRYPPHGQGQHNLTITETSNQSMLISLQNEQLRRVTDTGTPTSVPLTSGTTTTVTISGTPVTKIEATPSASGTRTVIYQWGNKGIWYQVETIPGSPLTEPVLEQIVGSMIAQQK